MGKVYSGLYHTNGHVVPYIVVVKVGKPSEVVKPGNRGKRDSQVMLMRFLNRIHFNKPLNPLELDIYHHIRNLIGIMPTFYEYILMVDSDTHVKPDAALRLVSAFVNDSLVIGACGETSLANGKSSITTMIQVYEYWISHNLSKAFESLFGSVTCLPGCFSMYRIYSSDSGKPLFCSDKILDAYSEPRADFLHEKNLLTLGEDRYLTTLLLKHFVKCKTILVREAMAFTNGPEHFSEFSSQRRRWINSTVHNLAELLSVNQLCGFCFFGMRFIVFLDLLSTIVQVLQNFISALSLQFANIKASIYCFHYLSYSVCSSGVISDTTVFAYYSWSYIWLPSPYLSLTSQVGNDNVDAALHPVNTDIFIRSTTLLFLENGRLHLGQNKDGERGKGQSLDIH